jgi:hypothetical protein
MEDCDAAFWLCFIIVSGKTGDHSMDVNPRANGFNYGVGWGSTPKPTIYTEAQQLALLLNREANAASRKAWALEMAIRNVRLAETDQEKEHQYRSSYSLCFNSPLK